jgi:hypothetical protein
MSELAHNLNGESFELPPAAIGWRVRKLKAKGAPEVVYGRDGIPLILPVDADMEDLRREARTEGKYRLDVLDEHNRPIAGCPAGYVCIHEGEPTFTAEPAALAKPVPVVTTADQALVEAMRIQAGLAQSVVDKFAMMLEASATLLRSAQNAGMPQRLPRFFLDVGEENRDDQDEDTEAKAEAEPAKPFPKSGLHAVIETIVTASAGAFVNAIVNGKIKIPGGLGALIDCRRAVPKDSGAEAPATHIPGGVPAPGPRDPAPATDAVIARAPVSFPGASPPAATTAAPTAVGASDTGTGAHAVVADVPDGLPTIDADTMQHFTNILNALTLEEQMHAQALAAELSPTELRTWIQELKSLSIAAGAARIRAVLGTGGSAGEGGAPVSSTLGALGKGGES